MQISIIIPTLNEESNIQELLSQLTRIQDDRIAEIIVADGGSSDSTAEMASKFPIKLLKLSQKSRAHQMNEGAKVSKVDTLYFIHADTRPPISFVDDINNAIQEGYPLSLIHI